MVYDEGELQKEVKIEWPKNENLVGQKVTDMNLFEALYSYAKSGDPAVPPAPRIIFRPATTAMWQRLQFQGLPFFISEDNVIDAITIPEKCQKQSYDIFKKTREYALQGQLGQVQAADHLWMREIKPRLDNRFKTGCADFIGGAYILASISSMDITHSPLTLRAFYTREGFRLTKNGPLLLLAAYLFNHGQLRLYKKDQVLSLGPQGAWAPAQSGGVEVLGAYNCEKPSIFLTDDQPPFDTAGTFLHEMSHLFRDVFGHKKTNLEAREKLLMDEAVAIVTAGVLQVHLLDYADVAMVRSSEDWRTESAAKLGVKINEAILPFHVLQDFSLFAEDGGLRDLYYKIYPRPRDRSMVPGMFPSEVFPSTLIQSIGFLGEFLNVTLLRSTQKVSTRIANSVQELLDLVFKAYFPEDNNFTRQQRLPQRLDREFDPFSKWMVQADNHFVVDGTGYDVLTPAPAGSEFFIQKSNGEDYYAEYVFEVRGRHETPYETVWVRGKDSADLQVKYDLNSLLSWIANKSKDLSTASPNCKAFIDPSTDLGSYVGRKLRIEFEEGSIHPGEKGVKTSSPTKPGEKGVKTSFTVRPNLRIPGL